MPYSCKRRMVCPSCDSKRAAVETERALSEILPCVPYRQWVLTVPKRLRYFVNRNPALSGELSRILAGTLARFKSRAPYNKSALFKRAGPGLCAGAVSRDTEIWIEGEPVRPRPRGRPDGVFALEDGTLKFHPAPTPTAEELAELSRSCGDGF